jgi:hypothetical protein
MQATMPNTPFHLAPASLSRSLGPPPLNRGVGRRAKGAVVEEEVICGSGETPTAN